MSVLLSVSVRPDALVTGRARGGAERLLRFQVIGGQWFVIGAAARSGRTATGALVEGL